MNTLQIGLFFFIISLLSSITGRGGGLIYLSILIYFNGLSAESKILSFILIITTSLPHIKKAIQIIDKTIIYKILMPSLITYFLMGLVNHKVNGTLFTGILLFIGITSLLYLWFPSQILKKDSNLLHGKTGLYSTFASGMSAYVGLSPSLLLIPFLSNQLKIDMKKAIPYLHFQNLIVVSIGLASIILSSNTGASLNFSQTGILVIIVLLGSCTGKLFLVKSNILWTKIIFTILSVLSLILTIYSTH